MDELQSGLLMVKSLMGRRFLVNYLIMVQMDELQSGPLMVKVSSREGFHHKGTTLEFIHLYSFSRQL
jgi:hypothetical protein